MKKTILLAPAAAVALVAVLLFSTAFSFIYNKDFYEHEYSKYNVYSRFSRERLSGVTDSLLKFFRGSGGLDATFFSRDEISHLQDVKVLISKLSLVHNMFLAMFLILVAILAYHDWKGFVENMTKVFSMCFFAVLFLFVMSFLLYLVFGFENLFSWFHMIFFTGNYTFNPEVSNMKYIFPDGFFMDTAKYILLFFFLESASLYVVAHFLKKGRAA